MQCVDVSEATSSERFGGKAANLARIHALRIAVPQTRVLGCEALGQFLASAKLWPRAEKHVASFGGAAPAAAIAKSYDELTAATRAAPVAPRLREAITEAARALLASAPAGLAVRSSAVFEDSAAASFAGVFESYLSVATPEAVVERVIDVWCSLWSPRALRYLHRMGITPRVDAMAVVLQPVLPATAAGVIYTADPRSGNPWQFHLRATRGLAADLLSGSGSGDEYRAEWDTGVILGDEHRDDPVLSDAQVAAVVRVARRLDEAFAARLDIEWVLVGDELSVVQARPMTALPEFFPADLPSADRSRTWQRAPFLVPLRGDHAPGLLTPLYRDMSETEQWFRYQPDDIVLVGTRYEERDLMGHRFVDTAKTQTFMNFFDGPAACEPWLDRNEARYRARWDRRHDELRAIETDANAALGATSRAADLIPVMLSVRDRLWDLNSFGWSGPQSLGWMCEWLLDHLGKPIGRAFRKETLLGGALSHTFEATRSLQKLGRSIGEPVVRDAFARLALNEIVPHLAVTYPNCAFLSAWEALCWRLGRTPPSWRGRPAFWVAGEAEVVSMHTVRTALRGESRDATEVQCASHEAANRAVEEARRALTGHMPDAVPTFDKVLQWTRYWTQAVNDRHGLGSGLLWEKELVWQVGRRLVKERVLGAPEEVLCLLREDLEAIATGGDASAHRALADGRRQEYLRFRRLKAPESLGAANKRTRSAGKPAPAGKATATRAACESGVWRGTCRVAGAVTGVARRVENIADPSLLDALTPEDILVLPSGDAFAYADWHSLLTLVRGVVAPGNPAHHLAQVARECGVPVLGGVATDLRAIPDGVRVQLDATGGVLRLLDE